MTRTIFTYGTLMCPDIMASVSGQPTIGVPGTLEGHRRRIVKGEVYPGIVPDPAESVPGVLYPDMSERAVARLDAFEGELYARTPVTVAGPGGDPVQAEAYVVKPHYADRLTGSPWEYEAFLAGGKGVFEAGYEGYGAIEAG